MVYGLMSLILQVFLVLGLAHLGSRVLDQACEICLESRVLGCTKSLRSLVPVFGYAHERRSSNSAHFFTFIKEILSKKICFSFSVNVLEKEYNKKIPTNILTTLSDVHQICRTKGSAPSFTSDI